MSSSLDRDHLLSRDEYEAVRATWQREIADDLAVLRILLDEDTVAAFQSYKSVVRAVYEARRDDTTLDVASWEYLIGACDVLLPDTSSIVCMLLRNPSAAITALGDPEGVQCWIGQEQLDCEAVGLLEDSQGHPDPRICRWNVDGDGKQRWMQEPVALRIPEWKIDVTLTDDQKQAVLETMISMMAESTDAPQVTRADS